MLCYPLNVGITDRPVAAPALCAPIEGAPCATNATLRLWATEGDAANALGSIGASGGDDDDVVGSKTHPTWSTPRRGRRQLILESLAKRARGGRAAAPRGTSCLPLLGVSAYFSVVKTEGHTAVVSTETSVRLRPKSGLADGEDDPAALESDDDEDDEKDDEKDDSSDDGDGTGSRPATPGERIARRASKRKGAAVRFEDLGGVSEFKEALLENVALPLTRREIFTTFGIKPPRGVLLWGPPGTGKSRLARAAADAAGANLLVVRGPELIGPVVGESEAALRGVFKGGGADQAVRGDDRRDRLHRPRAAGGRRRDGRGEGGRRRGRPCPTASSRRSSPSWTACPPRTSTCTGWWSWRPRTVAGDRPRVTQAGKVRQGDRGWRSDARVAAARDFRRQTSSRIARTHRRGRRRAVEGMPRVRRRGLRGAGEPGGVPGAETQGEGEGGVVVEERAGKFAPFTFKVGEALLKTEEQMREDMIRQDMLSLSWEERMEMSRKFDRSDACKTRTVTKADFEFAKKRVRPSALREVQIEVPKAFLGTTSAAITR